MTTKQIIEVINSFDKEYQDYKDGGREFITQLAKKLLNTIDEDRLEVIAFFLNEIRTNKNNFGQVALVTIVQMNASELGADIEAIYNEMWPVKDEKWRYSIIEALMKLRYTPPKSLYKDFVNAYLKDHPDDSFFLLVQYCIVDPEEALPLLSDYYVKNLFDYKNQDYIIGYICSYFLKIPLNYFPDFVRQTTTINKDAGFHLKNQILKYLNSERPKRFSKTLINERIESLQKIEV